MLLATLAVALLSGWDAARESQAALNDFGREQTALASGVAAGLAARAEGQPNPSDRDLLAMASRFSNAKDLVVLLRPPGSRAFLDPSGREMPSGDLAEALDANLTNIRLDRPSAAALGLPARMAVVGLAHAELRGGRWEVAVVATAERLRDRDRRGRARLWLAIGVAALLVLGFGGLALREQRRELQLEADLRLAALARERDEQLRRIGHSANLVALASGVAHEVSTPLGVIIGRAEQMLERSGGDERARRSATGILEQADRINEVVRGFLRLARGGTPALRDTPAEEVVAGAVALVEHRFAEACVGLRVSLPASLPPLRCDLRLLQHALINLLLNACDASPVGASVEVAAEIGTAGIAFVVSDRGAGIAPEDAARALAPFFTTKPEGKGTGMGLAIASEIAQSHRGSVSLAPRLSGGTRAQLQIPLALNLLDEAGDVHGQQAQPH